MPLSKEQKLHIAFATIEVYIQNGQRYAVSRLQAITKQLLKENKELKDKKYFCGRCRKEAIHRSEAVRADLCQPCLFALNKLLDSFMEECNTDD